MPISRIRARTLAACAALAVSLALPVAADADIRTLARNVCQCNGLSVAGDGTIFLADSTARQVHKLGPAGNLVATWRSGGGLNLASPWSAAPLPNGDVAITDVGAGGIHLVTQSGAFVRTIATGGGGDLVAGPDGTLYEGTYRAINRIAAGDAVTVWPFGSVVSNVSGIALSPANGHIYATDMGESVVREVTTDGTLVREFGGFGSGPGELSAPNDVAVDADGNVYVAEAGGRTGTFGIEKYSAAGAYLGRLAREPQPLNIAHHDGALYANESVGEMRLTRIDLRSPIAALSASSRGVVTSQQVTFDAGGSSMPFGSVTRYEWDLDGDGSYETDTGTTSTATRRFTAVGGQTVRVRVTGSTGATDVATVDVAVARSSAQLRASAANALTGQQVTLDASGSRLGDSDVTGVRWDLDGNGSHETDGGTSLITTGAWAAPGEVTVGVRIERSGGIVDTASARVTVVGAPPSGRVGVTVNDAAQYTNDPNVTLSVVWPAFASNVLVSNDGGFRAPAGRAPVHQIEWRLDASGPERLPKTVYVRFGGSSQTYTDDIILDQTAPVVQSAAAVPVGTSAARASAAAKKGKKGKRRGKPGKRRATRAKAYRVRVKASDRTSGVAKLQLAVSKRKPAKAVAYRSTLTVRGAKPRFARAIDRAGNVSGWKPLR